MAFVNPKGRANYEPNSWGGAAGGPREAPDKGFTSFPATTKARSGASARKPLPTITARPGSST